MPGYVLVADPEASFSEAARQEVRRAGLEAVVVRDGSAAHDLLVTRGAPVALICELALPKRDGFALLRGLRRVDTKRSVPALVASAFPAMRASAESLRKELGPMVVLAKPVGASTLRAALASALQGKSAPAPPPAARLPGAEEKRLARVAATALVDGEPPPEELQKVVASVARSFGVPVALMSLVLRDTQWFKAHHGIAGRLLANRGSPRDWSFCSHVVDGHRPLVVPDARNHPVFADNPLVQDGTVVGYAGVPLETPDGHVLGSLCIIDQQPLDIASAEIERLTVLARRVAGEIALREAERRIASASQRGRTAAPATTTAIAIPPAISPLAYMEAAMAVLDTGVIVFDERRCVSFANPQACAMLGVSGDAIAGKSRDEALRILASKLARAEDLERLRVPDEGPWALREVIELASPERRVVRWVAAPLPMPSGAGQLASLTDITAETDLATEREELAFKDALTGLLNRRGGHDALVREEARARRHETPLTLAMVDIDAFKAINDAHGHAVGDQVIGDVAAALARTLRASDAASRWGGEEFLVVLPDTPLEGAATLAERARAAVEATARVDGLRVTISVGIAPFDPYQPIGAAVVRADEALYRAKAGGRNRVAR